MFYVKFLASNRFLQNALLICDEEQVEELILGLENIDPHYKIVAFVSADTTEEDTPAYHYVQQIKREALFSFVKENSISEIVIASQKTEGITPELYQQLLHLLESGSIIRKYTQVYESKTQRIPVHYLSKDFYRYFPFSRSNHNKLYLLLIRFVELGVSVLGLSVGLVLFPIIVVGNAIGNRASYFIPKNGWAKMGLYLKF